MPRQSRGRAAPARHAPAPAAAPSRQAHTANAPAHAQHAPPPAVASSGGSGFFGNMMSTAAGVGIGSAVGHSIGNLLTGGGGGHAAAPPAEQQQQQTQAYGSNAYDSYGAMDGSNARASGAACETDAKQFTDCLAATKGDMQSCSYYLEQLKACQAAMRA